MGNSTVLGAAGGSSCVALMIGIRDAALLVSGSGATAKALVISEKVRLAPLLHACHDSSWAVMEIPRGILKRRVTQEDARRKWQETRPGVLRRHDPRHEMGLDVVENVL